MKMAAGFFLVVGWLWGLLVVWMFLTIAEVTDAPVSWFRVALFRGSMLVGPLVLIIASVLLLRGTSFRPGATLVGVGCVILTGFALYSSIIGMQRRLLQALPPYLFLRGAAADYGYQMLRRTESTRHWADAPEEDGAV